MRPAFYNLLANKIPEPDFDASLIKSLDLRRGVGVATFTRNSTATVFGYAADALPGDDQVLLTVDANEPRFEGARRVSSGVWDDKYSDGTPISVENLKGYMAEGSRTNLLTYSEQFDNWAKVASIITANVLGAPSGATTVDKLVANTTSATHYVRVSKSGLANSQYTISVFAKAGEHTHLAINANVGEYVWISYDLANGTVEYVGGANAIGSIQAVGNGWYRCIWTSVNSATSLDFSFSTGIIGGDLSGYTFAGNGSDGIYIWGAQLEAGAFSSSYIPTASASVARSGDVLAKTFYKVNNKKLSVSLEFISTHTPSGIAFLWGSYLDANNYTAILHDGTNLIARKRVSGINTDAVIANAFSINTFYKVLAVFTNQKCSIYSNGSKGTDAFSLSDLPVAAGYEIGSDGNGANQCFMNIRNHKIFDYALSDFQARNLQ